MNEDEIKFRKKKRIPFRGLTASVDDIIKFAELLLKNKEYMNLLEKNIDNLTHGDEEVEDNLNDMNIISKREFANSIFSDRTGVEMMQISGLGSDLAGRYFHGYIDSLYSEEARTFLEKYYRYELVDI